MHQVRIALCLLIGAALCGCNKEETTADAGGTGTTGTAKSTTNTASTTGTAETAGKTGTVSAMPPDALKELKVEDVKPGSGRAAAEGDVVIVTYTGTLKDGKVFDTNDKKEKDPLAVLIGSGSVIKGWEKGLVGVKKGMERKLSIPSELGYGERGQVSMGDPNGGIPPNSDLYFDLKILDVIKKDEEGVYDKEDVKVGTGPAVKSGDRIKVQYVGTFMNGKKFDSSRDRNAPFEFVLGKGAVIRGWDAGIIGMKKGGIRKLHLPPAIAYGAAGYPPSIAPYQSLNFEIELVEIVPPNKQ